MARASKEVTPEELHEIRNLEIPWCGSSSCRFGVPENAGMHTNSRCTCFEDVRPKVPTRAIWMSVKLSRSVPRLLKLVSRMCAAVRRSEQIVRAQMAGRGESADGSPVFEVNMAMGGCAVDRRFLTGESVEPTPQELLKLQAFAKMDKARLEGDLVAEAQAYLEGLSFIPGDTTESGLIKRMMEKMKEAA